MTILAAAVLAVPVVLVLSLLRLPPAPAAESDPELALRCPGYRGGTVVDYDDLAWEWRLPREQAQRWRDATAGFRTTQLVEQRVFTASPARVKVGYVNAQGDMAVVLTYEYGETGWLLRSINECA